MHPSADRTNSPRKRAGSRRNKKLKNVRSFKSDSACYPFCGHDHALTLSDIRASIDAAQLAQYAGMDLQTLDEAFRLPKIMAISSDLDEKIQASVKKLEESGYATPS